MISGDNTNNNIIPQEQNFISNNNNTNTSPNSASQPSGNFRRTYKACLNCRLRKVKCDFGDLANPSKPPCARCRREGRECQLVQSRRGGIRNILVGRERKAAAAAAAVSNGGSSGSGSGSSGSRRTDDEDDDDEEDDDDDDDNKRIINSTGNSPLSVGGRIGGAAGGSRGNGLSGLATINSSGKGNKNITSSSDAISVRELHNTSDALEILAHTARNFPKISGGNNSGASTPRNDSRFPPTTILAPGLAGSGIGTNSDNVRGGDIPPVLTGTTHQHTKQLTSQAPLPPSMKLSECELIAKEKIITESEARVLVDYFFTALHPFYPFIPESLHSPDIMADMPLLLAAVTTLASRYYVPEIEPHQNTKDVEEQCYAIHAKLWDYTQTLISKSVWAEASTRSIGTVFAFLLFSEWNPRAIHQRWKDYANNPSEREQANVATAGSDSSVGLGAARRSDRMSWMLIGLGIRLAQDLGLMESNPKVYLATHLSEIVLALRMGRRSMLGQFLNDPIPDLNFSTVEQAKLELLQIMSLAHETLYSSRNTTRELLKDGKYLNFLGLFSPHLDSWEIKYRTILKDPITENRSSSSISAASPASPPQPLILDNRQILERESLLFDFHYIRLYIYSLALLSNSENTNLVAVAEIIPSARYVAMATDAAKELLAVGIRVHSMGSLRRAPIRWLVRIVHGTVFLVKSLMLSNSLASRESQNRTISIIRKISTTLLEASPDEIHLASRYGTILGIMCSQLASKRDISSKRSTARKSRGSRSNKRTADDSNNSQQEDSKRTKFDSAKSENKHTVDDSISAYNNDSNTAEVFDNVQQSHTSFNTEGQSSHIQHHQFREEQQQQQQQQQYQQQQYQQQQPHATQLQDHFDSNHVLQPIQSSHLEQAQVPNFAIDDDVSINLSLLDVDFDFLMEGTEGLGFVEPLMEGIEQQQWLQQQQSSSVNT